MEGVTLAEFLAGHPFAAAVFQRTCSIAAANGPFTVRVSRSQIAFRRSRGFAFLWLPGRYLTKPGAEVVLSIALDRQVDSDRFKEVVRPAPGHWMHHLEIHDLADLDDEVGAWLREAAATAD